MRTIREHFKTAVDISSLVGVQGLACPDILVSQGHDIGVSTTACKKIEFDLDDDAYIVWRYPTEHVIMDIDFTIRGQSQAINVAFINWKDTTGTCLTTVVSNNTDTSNWFIPNWILPHRTPTLVITAPGKCSVTLTYQVGWFGVEGTNQFINNTFVPTMEWISDLCPGAIVLLNNPASVYDTWFRHDLFVAAMFTPTLGDTIRFIESGAPMQESVPDHQESIQDYQEAIQESVQPALADDDLASYFADFNDFNDFADTPLPPNISAIDLPELEHRGSGGQPILSSPISYTQRLCLVTPTVFADQGCHVSTAPLAIPGPGSSA